MPRPWSADLVASAGLILEIEITERPLLLSRTMKQALFISSIVQGGGKRRAYSLSTLNPHDTCGTIRLVGNYQLQAGRPSGSARRSATVCAANGMPGSTSTSMR